MEMESYRERIARYRIVRHDELPEAHKAEYRLNGIDPDTMYTLVWSFDDEAEAEAQLRECTKHAAHWQTYWLVDGGDEEITERPAWF